MKRVPNARDRVLARIDNTRRSSRAETNPSSYDSSIDTFRSSTTTGPPRHRVLRPALLEGVAVPGSPEPARQTGNNRVRVDEFR